MLIILSLRNRIASRSLALALIAGLMSGCGGGGGGDGGGSTPPASVSLPEDSYCGTALSISGPSVTISGSAEFQFRPTVLSGGKRVLSSAPSVKPIRRAEVHITDANGTILQCGETQNDGSFSLTAPLPTGASTYSVKVNSRGNNDFVKASILNDVDENRYYSVTNSVNVNPNSSSLNVGLLSASYTGTLEGGAFNIFDQILLVNEYLRNNTTHANCSSCSAFTVAPKALIYWKKGFTPGAFLGDETAAISFFDSSEIVGSPALFILGGVGGDVDNTDTDHFDNSVIIHEYGHFLENQFSRSDSPGGPHNGQFVIDPRLAFSEGFANFFASAVQADSFYIDTMGNQDGNPDNNITINLESSNNPSMDKIKTTSPLGEGEYREVSVSRLLWDLIDNATDSINVDGNGSIETTDNLSLSFAYIWHTLSSEASGFKNSSLFFRSMGLFNSLLENLIKSSFGNNSTEHTALSSLIAAEFQLSGRGAYAQNLTANGSSCTKTITPTALECYFSALGVCQEYKDNFFNSWKLYSYTHSGGPLSLNLNYTPTLSDGKYTDLDFYLFPQVHSLEDFDGDGVMDGAVGVSATTPTDPSASATESIQISNLSAGTYLIGVQAFIPSATPNKPGGPATFDVKIGSNHLCP